MEKKTCRILNIGRRKCKYFGATSLLELELFFSLFSAVPLSVDECTKTLSLCTACSPPQLRDPSPFTPDDLVPGLMPLTEPPPSLLTPRQPFSSSREMALSWLRSQ